MLDSRPYAIRRLLLDSEYGVAPIEKYSRRSFVARCEPLLLTTMFALIAVAGAMLLCEASRTE